MSSAPVTLRSLLATGPLLVLDAASLRVQVGLLGSGAPDTCLRARSGTEPETVPGAPASSDATGAATTAVRAPEVRPWPGRWWSEETEATTSLFRGLEHVLAAVDGDLGRVRGVIFCDGPGSILGIRTVAASVRTWTALRPADQPLPVWRYRSLELLAHALAATGEHEVRLLADARRESWHTLLIDAAGTVGSLARCSTAELAAVAPTVRLLTPAHFRAWSVAPRPLEIVGYDVAAALAVTADVPLLTPAPEPDAFTSEEPSYRAWTPAIHRAPT